MAKGANPRLRTQLMNHAFTASATQRVRHDIIEQLRLRDPYKHIASFRRPNLRYIVRQTDTRTQKIPIVMLTGCGQPVQAEYGKLCGADAYLTKPWDPKELMRTTKRLLSRAKSHK